MTSKKCSQCGLVNFAKFETCQRCNSPLDNHLPLATVPLVTKKSSQLESIKQNASDDYALKMLLKRCMKCGEEVNTSSYKFVFEWVSPVFPIGEFFIGPLIKLFRRDLSHTFTIHGHWCKKCIAARERAVILSKFVKIISIGFFALTLFSIIFFDVAFGPISIPAVFFFGVTGFAFMLAAPIFSAVYYKITLPKVIKLKRDKLIFEVPGGFEIECLATPNNRTN